MAKLAGAVLLAVLALWILSGIRTQSSVGTQQATVQAQQTAIARPAPTPTP